jgi:hypothetical protein
MVLIPDTSVSFQHNSNVLLGVIIDVSDSMRKSWRNTDGRKLPRIKVISDTLNRKIGEAQSKSAIQKNSLDHIEVFCLGFGFRYPLYIEQDITIVERDQPLKKKEKIDVIDLICDLLALSEILPSQEKLLEFKEQLSQKWQHCTKEILDQSVIVEDVFGELVDYLQGELYNTAMQKHQRSLLYNLSRHKLIHRFHWLSHFLEESIKNKEENITTTSQIAAQQYTDEILRKTDRDFTSNAEKYVSLIQGHLEKFIQAYAASTLQAFALGFTAVEIVDDLDEKLALSIAEQIYAELSAEVKHHIEMTLALYLQKLLLARRRIAAKLDKKEVQRLTKRFVQKYGWDFLKPLIEETVYKMFSQHFESEAKKSFSHWIRLASAREVVRPLTTLSTMLPNILEEYIYSEEVMFGTTPFRQALDRAAVRFVDEAYKDHKKVLMIISDGEFREETEVMVSANLLKKRGVTIISCLIHDRNLLSQFTMQAPKKWPSGAKRMLAIASEISDPVDVSNNSGKEPLMRALTGKKLCYQINHSDILDDLIENILLEKYRAIRK